MIDAIREAREYMEANDLADAGQPVWVYVTKLQADQLGEGITVEWEDDCGVMLRYDA